MTVNRPLNIDLREEHEIFNLDLCAILVARYTAVLCFKGTGEDTPQEMIAIDLTPGKLICIFFMLLVCHKKIYLIYDEITNFRIFTQPIPIFFKVQN